jgi:hypothetical protein
MIYWAADVLVLRGSQARLQRKAAIKSPSGHDVAVDNQAFLIHLKGK